MVYDRPDPRDRTRPCAGKIRHGTRKLAKRSARYHGRKDRRKLFVYLCEECNGWHLTKVSRENMEKRDG